MVKVSSQASDPGSSTRAVLFESEDLAYYITRDWPKTRQPRYFDVEDTTAANILEENFERIRDEIVAYYEQNTASFQPNFTPYAKAEAGWRTVNLYSYLLRYSKNCAKFPVTDEVVRKIPGMCLAQIGVLAPRTKLFAHFGDTNAVIRHHLGLVIPAGLPEVGIRVGRENRCWREGKVLAISIAHRHFAWNQTDRYRIVLLVDVIRPELEPRKYEIARNALAVITMKWFATRFPVTKDLPRPLTAVFQRLLAAVFGLRLRVQRAFGV